MAKELTAERLRELLDYDPETGEFTWRVTRTHGFAKAGEIAGRPHPVGYIQLSIDGRNYLAHRLAWFYMHGAWPENEIDHRNGARRDNRLINLRLATHAENLRNAKGRRHNKCRLKGVQRHHGRFRATIRLDGRTLRLGTFDTPEEAHAAYCRASTELHGEFGRTK